MLKRALKAFRKRLKVTLLDAETSLSGGPMSSGRQSSIVAVTPPDRYPRAVWDELVRQGRLKDARHGMYELPQLQNKPAVVRLAAGGWRLAGIMS